MARKQSCLAPETDSEPAPESVAGTTGTFTARFKDAMSRFPSGVTVVTTIDEDGAQRGFTANAFCSVSVEPPLVLTCLTTSADSYPAFCAASGWVVNILGERHRAVAKRFATKGADKFADGAFVTGPIGLPMLEDALVALTCRAHARHQAGDHVILVGEVLDVRIQDKSPLLYHVREFQQLSQSAKFSPTIT